MADFFWNHPDSEDTEPFLPKLQKMFLILQNVVSKEIDAFFLPGLASLERVWRVQK